MNVVISFLFIHSPLQFWSNRLQDQIKSCVTVSVFYKGINICTFLCFFFITELLCTRWNIICIAVLSNKFVFVLGSSMSVCYICFQFFVSIFNLIIQLCNGCIMERDFFFHLCTSILQTLLYTNVRSSFLKKMAYYT